MQELFTSAGDDEGKGVIAVAEHLLLVALGAVVFWTGWWLGHKQGRRESYVWGRLKEVERVAMAAREDTGSANQTSSLIQAREKMKGE